DLVAHVDRRAEALERTLDDLDRTVDSGTEAARLREDRVLRGAAVVGHQSTPRMWTSKRSACPASGWLKSNSACRSVSSFSTPAMRPPSGPAMSTTSPGR